MTTPDKKLFSTTLNNDLLKQFKKLTIDLERPINDVLEEAMKDLLKNIKFPLTELNTFANIQ